MKTKWIFALAILSLIIIFIVQNAQPVEITFLFWSLHTSRIVVIITTFFLGVALGWLFMILSKESEKAPDREKSTKHE